MQVHARVHTEQEPKSAPRRADSRTTSRPNDAPNASGLCTYIPALFLCFALREAGFAPAPPRAVRLRTATLCPQWPSRRPLRPLRNTPLHPYPLTSAALQGQWCGCAARPGFDQIAASASERSTGSALTSHFRSRSGRCDAETDPFARGHLGPSCVSGELRQRSLSAFSSCCHPTILPSVRVRLNAAFPERLPCSTTARARSAVFKSALSSLCFRRSVRS